jgi:SAM-dependent methyltransferase
VGSINRRRIASALALATVSGVVVNGIRLRCRLTSLPVLRVPEFPPEAGTIEEAPPVVVRAEGVTVDPATLRAGAAHLALHDVDAVDLVPGDLPSEDLLDQLRLSDRRQLWSNPIHQAAGAGQVVVLRASLAARAGIAGGAVDAVEVRRAFAEAKRYAPRRVDQAVAPTLRAAPLRDDQRLSVWRAEYGRPLPINLATRLVPALVAAGAAAAGATVAAGAVAVAAAAQPLLVTARTAARPPDRRRPGATLGRVAGVPLRLARAARGGWRPARPAHTDPAFIAGERHRYADDLAQGVERFRGPERDDCPICGSRDVHPRLRAPDMIQTKPGTFRVDTCAGCGTSFQNPRLTLEGLDFYYRDFYDGLGQADSEMMFASDLGHYQRRVGLATDHLDDDVAPRRWLDVGGGHGHFCLVATTELPRTRVELLDQSAGVDEAVRRGWAAAGRNELFPKAAPELEGQFDVVSMFHYLEHTVDPLAEVDAAWRVLEPGGLLVIELPAPDCHQARWFGWAYGPWMQPQHLHLMPMATVVAVLERRGFEVLRTDRRGPFQPFDATWAAFQVLTRLVPGPDAPWTPPRSAAHRSGRFLGLAAGVPLLALGALVDRLVFAPLLRVDDRLSSAFWVVARKP